MTSSTVIALPVLNLTPSRIVKVQAVASAFECHFVASHGWYTSLLVLKTRNSPMLPSTSNPPWSSMRIGSSAVAGTIIPALIVPPEAAAVLGAVAARAASVRP